MNYKVSSVIYFFHEKKLTKRIPHPSERCRLIFFSILCSHSIHSLRNLSRLAGGISSAFLDSHFVWINVFSKIIFLSIFAWVFLFSYSSIKTSTAPARRANCGISAIFFFIQLKKPASFIGVCIIGYHGDVKSFIFTSKCMVFVQTHIWNVKLNMFRIEICHIRYVIKVVYSFTINA